MAKFESRNWRQNSFACHFYTAVCFTKQAFPNFYLSAIIPDKTAYFSNNSHDSLKNADDSKFHITKLNPWKSTFQKQPITARDEIKANVILATIYKVKAKTFIIPIFYFSVSFLLYIVCCDTSAFSFFLSSKTFSRHLKNK